jgi:hypothetical protein
VGDGQRLVLVGSPCEVSGDEAGPGESAHGVKEAGITHTFLGDGPDEILRPAHDPAMVP